MLEHFARPQHFLQNFNKGIKAPQFTLMKCTFNYGGKEGKWRALEDQWWLGYDRVYREIFSLSFFFVCVCLPLHVTPSLFVLNEQKSRLLNQIVLVMIIALCVSLNANLSTLKFTFIHLVIYLFTKPYIHLSIHLFAFTYIHFSLALLHHVLVSVHI